MISSFDVVPGRLRKRGAFVRTEGLSAIAAAAEAAPNTSTGSVGRAFNLGSANCVVSPTRPRKPSVPRRRPFKMARSRPGRVRGQLPRCLHLLFCVKAWPGVPVHSNRSGSGAMAHGDNCGRCGQPNVNHNLTGALCRIFAARLQPRPIAPTTSNFKNVQLEW